MSSGARAVRRPTRRTSAPARHSSSSRWSSRDDNGNHITDLKRAKTSRSSKRGQPRDVAFFHYEGAPPAAIRVRAQPLPPGIYTNRPEYAPGPPRNITAILIDSLNTRAEDQVKVLAHILAFVSAVPTDTRVAIYRAGERVHVIHDFTDDIEGLRERLLKDGVAAPRERSGAVSRCSRWSSSHGRPTPWPRRWKRRSSSRIRRWRASKNDPTNSWKAAGSNSR